MTRIVLTLAVALTLVACEQPKKAPSPEAEAEAETTEGTGLPGVLDPKARMDEVKKDYEDALEKGAENRNQGIERSLGEGGEE